MTKILCPLLLALAALPASATTKVDARMITGVSGDVTSLAWSAITDKPSTFPATTPVATATALAATPTTCSAGQAARGVDASGNASGCFAPAGAYTLPAATASVIGGVKGTGSALACAGGQKATGFGADGTLQCATDADTIYTHPANHPPSIITQDASNRFVTDAEKTTWNAKAPTANPTFTGTVTAADATFSGTLTVGSSGATTIGTSATTVAALLATSSPVVGDLTPVSDGADGSDCATGGGSTWHWCRYTGASWVGVVAGSGGGTSYTLPTASASTLGGVKVGTGLAIDGSGVLSSSGSYTLLAATATVLGGVKGASASLTCAGGSVLNGFGADGAISCVTDQTGGGGYTLPDATSSVTGGVRVTNDLGGTATLPTVTATHLAAPLPLAQGGTGATTLAAAGIATLASPTFTGTPTVPGYLTTATAASTYAPLAAPTFTGVPAAPTAAVDTNTTQVATTAYVVGQGYLKSATATSTYAPTASPTHTGTTTVAGFKETVVAGGTCSTSYNVNAASGTMVTLTLSGACTIGVTSLLAGQSFTLYLTQSSTTAPTFSSAFKWAAGTAPTWSATATKYDTVACASPDGTKLICAATIDAR